MSRSMRERMRHRVRSVAALGICSWLATVPTACGYKLVKNSDLTVKRLAADSAAIASLNERITTLRAQCRADSLRYITALRAIPAPAPAAVNDSLVRARDAEIASLRDQLAKVTQELDRIKRRLANPRG